MSATDGVVPHRHAALATRLDVTGCCESIDTYYADPHAEWRTEAVLAPEYDTVPAAVLRAVAASELGLAEVTPRACFDHLLVLVA